MIEGILSFALWQKLLFLFVVTHITLMSVSLYLHRHSAHKALELHPVLKHFFRFWLWLTTGMGTKAWTAIHRKHHAKCETEEDPHSPVTFGLKKVLLEGAELYKAGSNKETLDRYGQGTPEDWLEKKVYEKYSILGLGIMLAIDLALFGASGIWMWAIQMIWIPLFAAGVINGLGHHAGYRNFDVEDASTNLYPWALFVMGEELHNNHHAYPSSAKFSMKPWEIDIGWFWINVFRVLGLAKVRKRHRYVSIDDANTGSKQFSVARNRFQVLSDYNRNVVLPVFRAETGRNDRFSRRCLRRVRRMLRLPSCRLNLRKQQQVGEVLAQKPLLKKMVEFRQELVNIFTAAGDIRKPLLAWCDKAEQGGETVLKNYANRLRRLLASDAPVAAAA